MLLFRMGGNIVGKMDRLREAAVTWRRYGGRFAPTASLEHLLARSGPPCPEGVRATEAWLLAAGGVGFSYKVYRGPWGLHVALEMVRPAGSGVGLRDACRRLGLAFQVEEISNARLAAQRLRQVLEASGAVLLWGSAAALPWSGLRPDLVPLVEHTWVVEGREAGGDGEEIFRVADLAPGPLHLGGDSLDAARDAPFAVQHRQLWFAEGAALDPMELPDPAALLEPTLSSLEDPLLPGQGLAGLEEWGRWLAGEEAVPRHRRESLRDGTQVFDVLVEIWRAVVGRTGGGALRDLGADFLADAAELEAVTTPARAEAWCGAEAAYRDLARRWDELARAALPAGLGLGEVRRRLEERQRVLRRGAGRGRLSSLAALDEGLARLRAEAGSSLEPSAAAVDAVFGELAERVADLARAEEKGAELLRRLRG